MITASKKQAIFNYYSIGILLFIATATSNFKSSESLTLLPDISAELNGCAKKPNVCQNGATCISKPGGNYICSCVNGWTGPDCSENVDDCSTAACEAGAICHDRVGHFYCECPPGKTGLLCQLNDGCYNHTCYGNSTCDTSPVDGKAICTCTPGFTGEDCSIDIDECAAGSPCEHGGSCVNMPGSFKCECQRGFSGSRCEVNIDECLVNPCLNEGTCLDEKGGYKCICAPGFTGQQCQTEIDECASNPCRNGAECLDSVNSYRCRCKQGYWGEHCEFSINGSSSLGAGNPWNRCSNPTQCFWAFKDGKCDQECNTADCLYDGYDCTPFAEITSKVHVPATIDNTNNNNNNRAIIPSNTINSKKCEDPQDTYCYRNYANGVCDLECNYAACGYDGLDCEPPTIDGETSSTEAQGVLVINVGKAIKLGNNDEYSKIELAKLMITLSRVTRAVLKIQSFNQNEDGSTEIVVTADNRKCESSCYNTTELMAKFYEAIKVANKTLGSDQYQNPEQLTVSYRSGLNFDQKPVANLYVVVFGSIAAACTLLMVISFNSKQKVKEKATIWFPDGFNIKPVLTSRNRDPTDRKPGRGVSTLQALGGNFFRGFKKNDRHISSNPNGMHSTDIDRSTTTPNGIYHEPYDNYDQCYTNGTDSASVMNNVNELMTPPHTQVDPNNIVGPDGITTLMLASMAMPSSKEPLGLVTYGTTGEMDGSADNCIADLLNKGAQLNVANKVTGETPLHLAARHGRVDAARGLLERCDSQDVNAQDATGRTPLHTAIAADSLGVFELLIRCRGTDLNAQTNDGTTPLILATRVGTYSMLEELILNECEVTKSDANGKTALHWAAATNNVDAIRRLLDVRETNKDAQDLAEETPLFLAAREGAKGAVEILLNHNANKEISDHMDRSPVEIARSRQHTDIVRLLEDHQPPTPRSMNGLHHRQMSPFSPLADSNSNSNSNSSTTQPISHYHSHTHSGGGSRNNGRQAQRAALARSNSTKPLIAEANIVRNNLQAHCKSVMVIKTEDKDQHDGNVNREVKTLGRRATQSTSSSHQVIQSNMHLNHFGAVSANNVIMPATPNSLTNSLSPVSSSMMSPPTNSLHHLHSPTKSNPPYNMNQMHRQTQHNNQLNQVPPPAYEDCQTYWTNTTNNNNNPNMVNVNNNVIDKTHGLSEVYNVPCLKNYMTPSPDSPFSMESMASPPGVYNDQQYQNLNHPTLTSQKQAGVYI